MTCPNHNLLLILCIFQDGGNTNIKYEICLDIAGQLIQKIKKWDIPNYV